MASRARSPASLDAAAHGELLISAVHGQNTIEALQPGIRRQGRDRKVLIDTGNELDFSKGRPPGVLASQDNCLAERIQAAFPNLKVVKSLNTIGAPVMVAPQALAGAASTRCSSPATTRRPRRRWAEVLKSFGWKDVLDLGYISSARGPEMYMAMWLRLWGATGTGMIYVKVVR